MSFMVDKQTLDDLNLLGKFRPGSIFNLFNQVRTTGGERLLDELFRNPLSDERAINQRCEVLAWFQRTVVVFPFSNEQLTTMQEFLDEGSGSRWQAVSGLAWKRLQAAVWKDEGYRQIFGGLRVTADVLRSCWILIRQLGDGLPFRPELLRLQEILADPRLSWLKKEDEDVSLLRMAGRWHLLSVTLRKEMEEVSALLYTIDVYLAVSRVARERGWSYARALPADMNAFHAEGLRHPGLERAVGNSLSFRADSNVLFLTGANMAGKSTFMKAFGIAVYLAHMGFPVAVQEMVFSVRDGLYSSINVPDDIQLGYSHFYAEVLRVKYVAQAVSTGKRLVVLFDELFKGTNVKDAYDGTLAVTEAFAGHRNSFYIISTHIIELGDVLQQRCTNIRFAYLPTVMEGSRPRYTYQLQPGITGDRQGMIIIENEKILELLDF